jgi:hypothetical protein
MLTWIGAAEAFAAHRVQALGRQRFRAASAACCPRVSAGQKLAAKGIVGLVTWARLVAMQDATQRLICIDGLDPSITVF